MLKEWFKGFRPYKGRGFAVPVGKDKEGAGWAWNRFRWLIWLRRLAFLLTPISKANVDDKSNEKATSLKRKMPRVENCWHVTNNEHVRHWLRVVFGLTGKKKQRKTSCERRNKCEIDSDDLNELRLGKWPNLEIETGLVVWIKRSRRRFGFKFSTVWFMTRKTRTGRRIRNNWLNDDWIESEHFKLKKKRIWRNLKYKRGLRTTENAQLRRFYSETKWCQRHVNRFVFCEIYVLSTLLNLDL